MRAIVILFVLTAAAVLSVACWWLGCRVLAVARDGAPEVRAAGAPGAPVPALAAGEARAFPIMQADTPALVREVVRLTDAATQADLPALRRAALGAADALVAGRAVRALGRLRGFASDPELLALTADARLRVRQDAITACGLDGSERALPYLERALHDGDAATRPLVLEALGRIGGTSARTMIEAVTADPAASTTDRAFALAALGRMRSR